MAAKNEALKKGKKEDFYVFLDFDGVLYDLKYLAENAPSPDWEGKSLLA